MREEVEVLGDGVEVTEGIVRCVGREREEDEGVEVEEGMVSLVEEQVLGVSSRKESGRVQEVSGGKGVCEGRKIDGGG